MIYLGAAGRTKQYAARGALVVFATAGCLPLLRFYPHFMHLPVQGCITMTKAKLVALCGSEPSLPLEARLRVAVDGTMLQEMKVKHDESMNPFKGTQCRLPNAPPFRVEKAAAPLIRRPWLATQLLV